MGNVNLKNPFDKKSQTPSIPQQMPSPIPLQMPPPIPQPMPPPIPQPMPPQPIPKPIPKLIPQQIPSSTKLTTSEKSITTSQPDLANINLYNNPMQQYSIIINENALKNCVLSAGNNIPALNQCVLSYIKGTHKVNDSTTQVVNLVSNNPNMSGELTTTLTQNDINSLTGTNLTAFDINTNGQFNNIKVNLKGLQETILFSDLNKALSNNVYGYDTSSNQFKNISMIASNYTVNSSGNLSIMSNLQNFENVEKFQSFQSSNVFIETKTIILLVCIILYLIIMSK
jgi:hypothetical protein